MTSASRLGHRTSGSQEETIRLGLTEAEAETLGMLLKLVQGANGKSGGPGSRRVHTDRILDNLRSLGVMALNDAADPVAGTVHFVEEETYEMPLNTESTVVVFL